MDIKKVKNWNLLWLIIPSSIVFIFSLVTFIVASFFDMEISQEMSKLFNSKFGVWISYYVFSSGNFLLFFGLFLAFSIIIENIHISIKSKSENKICNDLFIWLVYFAFFVVFLIFCLYKIISIKYKDSGWGKGVIVEFQDTYHMLQMFNIFWTVFSFLFFGIVTYYMRIKLQKDPNFLKENYWIDGIKIIIFSFSIYFIVLILKLLMGRPFYFSIIYESEIKSVLISRGFTETVNNTWKEQAFSPWWKPYNFIDNWTRIFTGKWDGRVLNNAFPSGHMASSSVLFSVIYLGIKKPNNKYRKFMIGFSFIMWIQLFLTWFGMNIYGFHWATDLSFTMIISILFFIFIQIIFERKRIKLSNKFEIYIDKKWIKLSNKFEF